MPLSFRRRREAESDPPEKEGWSSTLRFLLLLAFLAWAVRSLLFAPFHIPSTSMLPALYVGDYVVVSKWPYGYSRQSFPFRFPPFEGRVLARLPKRGDVVVFRPPGARIDFVKRVIGLPGDTVEVRGGMLVLNGEAIAREPFGNFAIPVSPNSPCLVMPPATPFIVRTERGENCLYPTYLERLPDGPVYRVIDQVDIPRFDDFPAVRVPEGHLFMLGDNRDQSLDSRFSPAEGGVGLVPIESLVGRASSIFWSTDGSAVYWKPWTWFTALRADRLGQRFRSVE
ncbi:MAG TPA: signal peptidase I [Sphingomicrobium sp.]|nr:signal peptidase I [Sphingomicrobium sp.]